LVEGVRGVGLPATGSGRLRAKHPAAGSANEAEQLYRDRGLRWLAGHDGNAGIRDLLKAQI
jgi:hypothetical protein